MSERITKVFIPKRKKKVQLNELKSEHRHQKQIEGEPADWNIGEFLDDCMQFWLGFTHLLA